MSRSVVTYAARSDGTPALAATPGAPAPQPDDKYKDRLLKYVPAEAVTLYVTLTTLAATATGLPGWIGWAILVVGVLATVAYLRLTLNVTDNVQLTISAVSFLVWAFALGGPFSALAWYKPVYGGLLLPVFTFFVALIKTKPVDPS